jgi:hypothetical protein
LVTVGPVRRRRLGQSPRTWAGDLADDALVAVMDIQIGMLAAQSGVALKNRVGIWN